MGGKWGGGKEEGSRKETLFRGTEAQETHCIWRREGLQVKINKSGMVRFRQRLVAVQPDQVWISVTDISGSPFEMEAATKTDKKKTPFISPVVLFLLASYQQRAAQPCKDAISL